MRLNKPNFHFGELSDKGIQGYHPIKTPEYNSLIEFGKKIVEIRKSIEVGKSIAPIISKILEFLAPYLKKSYANRWEEIENDYGILRSIAGPFVSINDFLNSVALEQFEEDEIPEERPVLSTIHSAKGLEWNTVFVIGLVEFWFPLNWAIKETGTDRRKEGCFMWQLLGRKRN